MVRCSNTSIAKHHKRRVPAHMTSLQCNKHSASNPTASHGLDNVEMTCRCHCSTMHGLHAASYLHARLACPIGAASPCTRTVTTFQSEASDSFMVRSLTLCSSLRTEAVAWQVLHTCWTTRLMQDDERCRSGLGLTCCYSRAQGAELVSNSVCTGRSWSSGSSCGITPGKERCVERYGRARLGP